MRTWHHTHTHTQKIVSSLIPLQLLSIIHYYNQHYQHYCIKQIDLLSSGTTSTQPTRDSVLPFRCNSTLVIDQISIPYVLFGILKTLFHLPFPFIYRFFFTTDQVSKFCSVCGSALFLMQVHHFFLLLWIDTQNIRKPVHVSSSIRNWKDCGVSFAY